MVIKERADPRLMPRQSSEAALLLRSNRRVWGASLFLAAVAAVTGGAAGASIATPNTPSSPTSNLTVGCVKHFQKGVDYFPDKVSITDATNFTVKYHDAYKVLTIKQPYPGGAPVSYVLVQCGTPTPQLSGALASAEVIQVPVHRVIVWSTTQLPDFRLLGAASDVVGVANTQQVVESAYKHSIDDGTMVSVAPTGTLNAEVAIGTHADLYITEGVAAPGPLDSQVEAAGIADVQGPDYLEQTPLGRAEWIKLDSVFLNKESIANTQFSAIADAYHNLEKLAATVTTRPEVFMGVEAAGNWYVQGGKSFEAQFIHDAGGKYEYANNKDSGPFAASFESIVEPASAARYWLNDLPRNGWQTLPQLEAVDPRISQFPAVQKGEVWATTKEDNFATGGNNYWELGVVRPDLILGDIIAILHPSLEPHHHFSFYEQLSAS